jgi:tetratricopeptide (TPR) repeat protein
MEDMTGKFAGQGARSPSMHSSWIRLSGLILLLVALASGAAYAEEDKTLLRAREGAAALMRGQYDKAVAAYDEALTAPEIADDIEASIYSDRGVAKWRMKLTKEAIDDFNKSIQLSPENATVYNNRGNALMDLGHPDEAVKDFDRAIALSPNYGAARNNRGNAHAALGQYEPAFQDYRKAVELMPQSAVPFNGRGKAHEELKRYHAAVRDLTRAITLNPKYAAAYHNRADAYLAIGMYKEAADDATQAIDLQPPDTPDPDLLLLRARAYSGDKKFNPAVDDLNKVIELMPDRVDAYVERGMVFTQVRRFDDAIGDLTRAIEIDPKNVKAYAMRAQARLQAEANDDALSDINQALEIANNDPLALRIRGSVYEALTRTDEAIADYRNALAQDPFQAESRDALQRLGQEVPPEEGQPLGPPVSGWVITEQQSDRYIASNPKYPSLRVELEMFGSGKPKIVEWKPMKDALSGIGLLQYYAGDFGEGQDTSLEYVAIVDIRANKVLSVEPHSWGSAAAQWNWQAVSVVVTDPDGNANEVQLRKVRRAPAVARDDFWFEQPRGADSAGGGGAGGGGGGAAARRAARRGGGGAGGGAGMFDWLFR